MLTQHVESSLTAYDHGELAPDESRRVAEHLLRCVRCRSAYDEVRFAGSLARRLPTVEAPDDLWDEIESTLASRETAAARPARVAWFQFAAAASIAFVALGAGLFWYMTRASGPTWVVSSLGGSPHVGSSAVGEDGRIGVGDALVTDGESRAKISVGAIGTVDVDPNSRVRLIEATMTEHRLALDHGTLHARIWAPPRLFFVDTPSGIAVDYGCAYTLSVDDDGASLLHVTSGWVALELNGRESLVPAGALCRTSPGRGPGTPYFEDAPDELRAALTRYDFEGGGTSSLDVVLSDARPRDSLTLWYLLSRAAPDERVRVYDRLAALAPPPAGVTRDAVLALDPTAIDRWRSTLEDDW